MNQICLTVLLLSAQKWFDPENDSKGFCYVLFGELWLQY